LEAWKVDKNLGLFQRKHQIGRGISTSVSKAVWFGSMEVALRFFEESQKQGYKEYFLEEVDIHARLAHPKVVSLLGFVFGRESCFTVLELMDGDLSALMERRMQEDSKREAPFSILEACDIMLQVAEGMQYLHQNGVVHMDLNSMKILVKSSRDDVAEHVCAKVSDLGNSEKKERIIIMDDPTRNRPMSKWMAPELMRVRQMSENCVLKHPFKSDVHSFGMLCYEIVTGNVPFSNVGPYELKKKVLRGDRPELPSQCPQSLKNLIKLCWDPEPITRPSFAEICEELGYIRCSLLLGTFPLGTSPLHILVMDYAAVTCIFG
jgi:serine/threonine protein kinase